MPMKNIFCTLFLPAFAGNVEAATYYVPPAGNDRNAGTSLETPFRTPQHCADIAVAGDTCYFRGGVYRSSRTILVTPRSGTTGVPIVFKNYVSEMPVFSVPLKTDGVYGIDLSNTSWIVIEGLRIVGGEFGIVLRDSSSHNQLLNNDVSRGYRGGIDIEQASSSNLIKGNKVYDNSRINWPRGNVSLGDEVSGSGVKIDDGSDYNVVENNYVYWNHGGGVVLAKAHYTIVHRNVIADNWGENLHMTGRNNVVDGNFIYLSQAAKTWPVTQEDNRSNADGIAVSIEAPGKSPIGT